MSFLFLCMIVEYIGCARLLGPSSCSLCRGSGYGRAHASCAPRDRPFPIPTIEIQGPCPGERYGRYKNV